MYLWTKELDLNGFVCIGQNTAFDCKYQIGIHSSLECCFKRFYCFAGICGHRETDFLSWLSDNRNFVDVHKKIENVFRMWNAAKCFLVVNEKKYFSYKQRSFLKSMLICHIFSPLLDWWYKSNCPHKEMNIGMIYSTPNLKWKGSVTIRKLVFYVQ